MNKPKQIFLLEDDEEILDLLTHFLSKAGFQTTSFYTIKSLNQFLIANSPDLIIADVHLEKETALDFLKIRKGDSDLLKIPVIMLSAENNEKWVKKIIEYKIDDYLLKPINTKLLLDSITKILQ